MFTDRVVLNFHLQVNRWNDGNQAENARLSVLGTEIRKSLVDKSQLLRDGWNGPITDGWARIFDSVGAVRAHGEH